MTDAHNPLTTRRKIAARAGGLLFIGSLTPHEAATGRLAGVHSAIPDVLGPTKVGLFYFDVPERAVIAQAWTIYQRLAHVLGEHGLSLHNVVRQRLFIRDIRNLRAVERVMDIALGDWRPATTIAVMPAGEINSELHLQIDAVASFDRTTIKTVGGDASARYPDAVRAGDFVFTSAIAGRRGKDPLDIPPQDHLLVTPMQQRGYEEASLTFKKLQQVLAKAGCGIGDVLKVNGWVDFPMRDYGGVILARRRFFDGTNANMMASTGLRVGGTCDPNSLVAFDAVALVPGAKAGGKETTGVASPIASPFVAGAVRGGGLVFSSGEIPVRVPEGEVMSECARLPDEGWRLRDGHIEPESGIESRAWYIYRTLTEHLGRLGVSFDDVVHQTVYIEHAREFSALERIATLYFGRTLPPTTVVPIADTTPFRPAELEIDLVAVDKA